VERSATGGAEGGERLLPRGLQGVGEWNGAGVEEGVAYAVSTWCSEGTELYSTLL
jgi:hypothetical protein